MWKEVNTENIKEIRAFELKISRVSVTDLSYILSYINFFNNKNCWYYIDYEKNFIIYYLFINFRGKDMNFASINADDEDIVKCINISLEIHEKKSPLNQLSIENITKSQMNIIKSDNHINFSFKDRQTDNYLYQHYIYLKNQLIKYPGNKMQKKRNLYNYYIKNHLGNSKVENINKNNINIAKEYVEEWFNFYNKTAASKSKLSYYHFCEEVEYTKLYLNNFFSLDSIGYLFFINNKIRGLTIIRQISSKMSVLVCNKCCDINSKGLFQFAISHTIENGGGNVEYIDFQDDAADEGLKKSKLSYHPNMLIERHSIEVWK